MQGSLITLQGKKLIGLFSIIRSAMALWVPIASMVTIHPFIIHLHLTKGQSGSISPNTDHMNRQFTLRFIMLTAKRLAVDIDNFLLMSGIGRLYP